MQNCSRSPVILDVRFSRTFYQRLHIFQIAARNCRKRKGEIILVLEEELEVVRQTKLRTLEVRDQLLASHAAWRLRLESLERQVLDQMAGVAGGCAQSWTLVTEGSSVKVVDTLVS